MVKAAKDANFNAIFVQVRKRGDAYYQSALEPKAKGVAADYDPLADILRQAHAAGLQVHAWLAVYEVAQTTGWNVEDRGNHISKVHPDWLMSDKDGKTTIGKSRVFVDPGLPAVQDNFVAIVRDILTKYSVDGIHLEDPGYRDPNAGYNSGSVAKFNEIAQRTGIPATTDEDWRQWRTAQVTNLIRGVHNAIKAIRPSAALSVCVASYSPNDTRKDSLQEWDVWAREGLVDFLVPMLSSSQEYMSGIASSAVASAAGRHIYI